MTRLMPTASGAFVYRPAGTGGESVPDETSPCRFRFIAREMKFVYIVALNSTSRADILRADNRTDRPGTGRPTLHDMLVDGIPTRPIRVVGDDPPVVRVIDQRLLPFELAVRDLATLEDAVDAIGSMMVRGAPLIGVTAAYGLYLAAREAPADRFDEHVRDSAARLKGTRPTAVNLAWAIDRQFAEIDPAASIPEKIASLRASADRIAEEDAEQCRMIGEHGLELIREISRRKGGGRVNILTHCNAGWLACVDYGTATAPIYLAHDEGIDIHVWVDETRPRNQGARLTAWELANHGVPHTLIVDNAGGHLMQHGMVDAVIVGCDRATVTGDVCNKIGTYLKALAANDNGVPFYVAVPSSTFDFTMRDGVREIPIEEREPGEVRFFEGAPEGSPSEVGRVMTAPAKTPVANYGFDVTPARLVTALITERGVCAANETGIRELFMEVAHDDR